MVIVIGNYHFERQDRKKFLASKRHRMLKSHAATALSSCSRPTRWTQDELFWSNAGSPGLR